MLCMSSDNLHFYHSTVCVYLWYPVRREEERRGFLSWLEASALLACLCEGRRKLEVLPTAATFWEVSVGLYPFPRLPCTNPTQPENEMSAILASIYLDSNKKERQIEQPTALKEFQNENFPFLLIFALSIIQSIFGVGLLVFGTPTLLIMGYSFGCSTTDDKKTT